MHGSYQVIKNKDIGSLLFGQQHIYSQDFFTEQGLLYHSVPVRDFPHYKFIDKYLDNFSVDNIYAKYLLKSWDYYYGQKENTEQRRNDKINSYINLFRDVEKKKHLNEMAIKHPIDLCRRPDGRIVIIDGNHRAAIALKLGIDIRAHFTKMRSYLKKIVAVPDAFYGTKRMNRPYQSIFYEKKELIKGRRRDMYERIKKLPNKDIIGKNVLDLGCNIGVNSFIAAEQGANKVLGIEGNKKIATVATRLNAIFAYPCFFKAHDLNTRLDNIGSFDTVFCFSLVDHLTNLEEFCATLKKVVRHVLFFEGHENSTQGDYQYILNKNNYSRIDLIGFTADGAHSRKCSRPLFRCEL